MKMHCQYADTCLPDYWGGHYLPHVAIVVWRDMTMGQVREAIRDELKQGAVMGSDDIARLLAADLVMPSDEKRADAVTRAAYAAVNRDVKLRKGGPRKPFHFLPEQHDGECSHAYFVFVIEE